MWWKLLRTIEKIRLALFMINKAARDYGSARLDVAFRFLALYRRRFSPTEIAECDLLNIADERISIHSFVSNEELLDLQVELNPVHLSSETENKLVFSELCNQRGIPTTKKVGEFCIGKASDGVAILAASVVEQTISKLPIGEYVLKPAYGCHGDGVFVFSTSGAADVRELEIQIIQHCQLNARFQHWLVEERLFNHPRVLELSPAKALQTLRVVTFVDRHGDVSVLAAQWRLASASAVIDNFCFGTNSSLLCNVLPESGEIEVAYRGKNFPYEFGLDATSRHMETGEILVGKRVPLWDEVVRLARRAALEFLPARSIGWDVAVTTSGPVVVEGNRYWDAHNEDGKMRTRLSWMQERR